VKIEWGYAEIGSGIGMKQEEDQTEVDFWIEVQGQSGLRYVCMYVYVCMCVCMYVCMYMWVCMCLCMYLYVCVCV